MVLHSDVKDTIFQNDVFQFYNSSKPFFGVSEEDIILTNKRNKRWILTICNESIFYDYFANHSVNCA